METPGHRPIYAQKSPQTLTQKQSSYDTCHLYLSLTLIVNYFEHDVDVNGVESNIKFPPPFFSELTSRIEAISTHTGAGETEFLSTSFSRVSINHKSHGTKSLKEDSHLLVVKSLSMNHIILFYIEL